MRITLRATALALACYIPFIGTAAGSKKCDKTCTDHPEPFLRQQ